MHICSHALNCPVRYIPQLRIFWWSYQLRGSIMLFHLLSVIFHNMKFSNIYHIYEFHSEETEQWTFPFVWIELLLPNFPSISDTRLLNKQTTKHLPQKQVDGKWEWRISFDWLCLFWFFYCFKFWLWKSQSNQYIWLNLVPPTPICQMY